MEKKKKGSSRTNKRNVSPSTNLLMEFNQFREIFYRFLSRSFSKEPDRQFLKDLPALSRALKLVASDLKENDLLQGRQLLEDFLQETRETGEEIILEDLAEQYASIFLGVGPENVSLCESAYRNERGLLFQDSYFEVLDEYRKLGLMKREDFAEPEDHLSVELALMAHLCRWSVHSLRTKNREETEVCHRLQKAFLDNHINRWIPRFIEGLLKVSSSKYYRALAHLLDGFIRLDREWVDNLISELGTKEASSITKIRQQRRGGENRLNVKDDSKQFFFRRGAKIWS